MTLRETLRLPCFAQARVVAGERGLERIIRRVHVVDIPDAEYTWGKDALLLTAGYGLRDSPERQAQLIPTLVARGLSGMVLAVGWYFDAVPEQIRSAADSSDFAVIETPRETQFVTITEQLYTEIVKEQVTREAQQALRGDFLDELLREDSTVSAVVRQRAHAIGFRLEKAHQVLVLRTQEPTDALLSHVEGWLRGQGHAALVVARETGIVVLVESHLPRAGRQLGEQLVHSMNGANPDVRVGMSDRVAPYQSPKSAYAQAVEAANIAAMSTSAMNTTQELDAAERVVEFSELGMLDWLYQLSPEALSTNLYWRKICALAEHDERTRADLVRTLETYLEHGGALAEAAAALNVHRNTLLYRLGRIQEFLDVDLKNVGQRLNLHVAVKAFRLKYSQNPRPPQSPFVWRAE